MLIYLFCDGKTEDNLAQVIFCKVWILNINIKILITYNDNDGSLNIIILIILQYTFLVLQADMPNYLNIL